MTVKIASVDGVMALFSKSLITKTTRSLSKLPSKFMIRMETKVTKTENSTDLPINNKYLMLPSLGLCLSVPLVSTETTK